MAALAGLAQAASLALPGTGQPVWWLQCVSMVVLAGVATVTLICAFAFPDRPEELRPELWAQAPEFERARGPVPQPAE